LHPKDSKSEHNAGETVKFLLSLTPELKKRMKEEAHKMFGKRKGGESLYVEMVLRIHLHMNVDGVNET